MTKTTTTGLSALAGLLLSATCLALASPASAQVVSSPDDVALARTDLFARDQNLGVLDRPRPEYAPLGIHAGSFRIQPELDTSLEYNDNIYAVPNGQTSDEIFHVSPVLTATSDWNRNQVSFYGRGAFNEYANHSTESTENGAVGFTGRLDVLHDIGVAVGGSFEHNSESRTSINSPTIAVSPIQYNIGSYFLVGAWQLPSLRLSARYDHQVYHYENGLLANGSALYQKDRDYNIDIGTFRAEYALLPGTSIFGNVVVNSQQNFDLLPTDVSRTSSGYEVTVGSNFDLTHLIRGEVFIGYLDQSFESQRIYKEVTGVSLRGYVQWYPTQLLTFTFSGSRLPVDSAIPGVGAYLDSSYSARADYELLRNLLITAAVTYENDDFPGINRTDNRNYETLTATYLMNRRVGLSLSYQHQENSSSGALSGLDFNVNSLSVGLTLRY